jgi:hypothetical protein
MPPFIHLPAPTDEPTESQSPGPSYDGQDGRRGGGAGSGCSLVRHGVTHGGLAPYNMFTGLLSAF